MTSCKLSLCVKIAAFFGVAFACYACSTQATVSGNEDSTMVLTNSYSQVRYDGCFWNDRLWENDWTEKKSVRHTLKCVRVRIAPWQSVAALATLGVWDTVEASVNPSFDIENVPVKVLRVYHALALDEWRYTFNPTRFNPSDKVHEVWFPGCHTDVGGGHEERALANASLWWMISGAQAAGLEIDEEMVESFLATRSSEVYYHDELSEGEGRKRWKALNVAAGYAGRFYRTVGEYDTVHSARDWYASAAPTERTRIPNTCIVLNAEPHRSVVRAVV